VQLTLIRHARPGHTAADQAAARAADPGLAVRGIEQAERTASFLTAEPIEAIYVSPARRARETAAPLEAALGRAAIVIDDLAEWDRDGDVYLPVEELRAAGHPRWRALERGDFYDDGVDQKAFRRRVLAAIDPLVTNHPGGQVAIVTHSGVINAYAGHVLGQEKAFWLALPHSPAYCSVSRILADGSRKRRIISLNETSHIRDLLAL
jgi:2,3-bisphosphoglycerate-dependent phosphoglycerate mutase